MAVKDISTMFRHLYRRLTTPYPMAPRVDLSGKKIIVTGAGSGSIGYETAQTLASWGALVVLTTRSQPEKTAAQLQGELAARGIAAQVDSHPLDVNSPASVAEFVSWYNARHGERLDVLINNAGVHLDLLSQWKEPQISPDGFEQHWRTNYLGPMQLTFSLLPLLQKTGKNLGGARVVNVSSLLHLRARNADLFRPKKPYNSWDAYGISKLGLVHNAFEINRRFAASHHLLGITLHPGSIATNISHKGLAGRPLLQKLRRLFSSLEAKLLLTPEQGAQTTILCASSPNITGGAYYDRCERGAVSAEANDLATARRLWQNTESWVNNLQQKQVANL